MSLQNLIQKWQSVMAVSGRINGWTIMERSTWQTLESVQTLTCPVVRASDVEEFQQAYEWMKLSMAEAGLSAPASKLTPWWCWVQREPDHPHPYLEDADGYDDPVVLQLSIPAANVVLSCFDLWHWALNRWYVPANLEDEADYEIAMKATGVDPEIVVQLEKRLQSSWLTIFDLDQDKIDARPFSSKSIQGCFWRLEKSYVEAVLEREDLESYEASE
ncbi:DUF3841 domain-containing protein [Pseudomonas sp. NA-150]|uniref:DUF3841 domain-containing protein n=1 Tax=Pseudomonas sp. NA-150 TaxID=3367525 RepID=UPI0037C74BCB